MPENLKMFAGINVKDELVHQLRHLDTFNGDGMQIVEKQMEKAKIEEAIRLNNAGGAIDAEAGSSEKKKGGQRKKGKARPIPSLDELLAALEDANR